MGTGSHASGLEPTLRTAIHRSVVVTVCREGIRVHGPTQLPDWAAFRAHADLVDRMLDRQYRLVRPAGRAQAKRDVLLPPEQAARRPSSISC